jgi:hypothetical protein
MVRHAWATPALLRSSSTSRGRRATRATSRPRREDNPDQLEIAALDRRRHPLQCIPGHPNPFPQDSQRPVETAPRRRIGGPRAAGRRGHRSETRPAGPARRTPSRQPGWPLTLATRRRTPRRASADIPPTKCAPRAPGRYRPRQRRTCSAAAKKCQPALLAAPRGVVARSPLPEVGARARATRCRVLSTSVPMISANPRIRADEG